MNATNSGFLTFHLVYKTGATQAYVDGVKPDIILGQGDTREEAVSDLLSAVRCYEETFGTRLLD